MDKSIVARVARIEHEFKMFRIPHPRLLAVRERIAELRETARLARAANAGRPNSPVPHKFIPIIAVSGSGKSTSVLDYIDNVVAKEDLSDGRRPVVHVSLSAKANTKRLGSDILEAFGDPDFEDGTSEQLLRRAYNHLNLAQTEVLILDEFQHLINQDTKLATAWSVTETIKRMLIQGVCPMILIGTLEAKPLLLTNAQMRSRCLEPIFLDPLDGKLAEEWKMFRDFCGGIDLKMVEHKLAAKPSGLVAGDIPNCLWDVSKGVIGIVANVVMHAAKHAVRNGRDGVTRDDLDHAVQAWAIPTGVTNYNAFRHGARSLELKKVA